jgi:hypothetical protein
VAVQENAFHLFDFQVRDEVLGTNSRSSSSSSGSSSGFPKHNKGKKRFVIQMFGISEQRVSNHEPFLYAKVPESWGFDAKTLFITELKTAVGKYGEDSIRVDECKSFDARRSTGLTAARSTNPQIQKHGVV